MLGGILCGSVLPHGFMNYLGSRVDRQLADNTKLSRNIKKRAKCEEPQGFRILSQGDGQWWPVYKQEAIPVHMQKTESNLTIIAEK